MCLDLKDPLKGYRANNFGNIDKINKFSSKRLYIVFSTKNLQQITIQDLSVIHPGMKCVAVNVRLHVFRQMISKIVRATILRPRGALLLVLAVLSLNRLPAQLTGGDPFRLVTNHRLGPEKETNSDTLLRVLAVTSGPNAVSGMLSSSAGHYNDTAPSVTQKNNGRAWLVAGAHAAIWGGTFVALNRVWYKDYPRSSFHFFDDRKEWNQIDKAGHVWTAYQLSRASAEAWKWSGINGRKAAWLGGASAFAFQSIIEILDGFSEEWGFSVGDMEANLIGSGGYVAQQLLFHQQIFQVKMGYKPYDYPSELKPRRNQLFGTTIPEQILKDYNSQRYWLSANISSLIPASNLPPWLNIAIGVSSDGLYGGHENIWTDKLGNFFDRRDIKRVRRFYLAPDIDLTLIRTNSKLLRSLFFVLNSIKIPAPAIEYNTNGKLRLHALMF